MTSTRQIKDYKSWKMMSYVGAVSSTAVNFAATYLYPNISITFNSVAAGFALCYSIFKNQENVQLIQHDEGISRACLARLGQEDLRGFSEKNIIDLLILRDKDSLDQFQHYHSQAQYWSTINLIFQLLGGLVAQGIYQAANREADHESSLHSFWNLLIVPLAMLLQMATHIVCAHQINAPKNESKELREKIQQKSHIYSDPGVRLEMFTREEQGIRRLMAEWAEQVRVLGAEMDGGQAQLAQCQADLRRETEPYKKDDYFIAGAEEDTIRAWKNPHTDVSLKLLASEETSEARYTEVYDNVIQPRTAEIKKLKAKTEKLVNERNDFLHRQGDLEQSLALITPKIAEDRTTLAAARSAAIFAMG
jgi:FtsZ-binding cell division protein ZapB